MSSWLSDSRLDESLIPVIQKIRDQTSPEHLKNSQIDEQYDVSNEVYTRLQNYVFSQGFAVVTGFCDNKIRAGHKTENLMGVGPLNTVG
jgi:hypothetical protein